MTKEKAVIWLDGITEFSLAALVFTLPFSKSMVEIFFVCALVCWFIKRGIVHSSMCTDAKEVLKEKIAWVISSFKPVKTELNLSIYAFVFIWFLSMLTTVSLPLSLEGFFFKLFEAVMIYFMTVETINDRKRLNRFCLVLLSSIALIGIDGIFQVVTGADFIRNYDILVHSNQIHRVRACFISPNSLAAWLIVMIPFVLSLAYFWKNNWLNLPSGNNGLKVVMKPALWVLAGILIGCLILTYTRGAWVALLLAILFVGLKKNKKLFIGIIVAVIILTIPLFIAQGSIKGRAISILSFEDGGSKNVRIKLWQEALSIIKDFPILGCGPNTYTAIIPIYKKQLPYTGYYPHNSYLHLAAETGLLGLGTFIWIILTLFVKSLANLKKIAEPFYNALLLGLLAGLLGFLAHSFIDVNFYTLQLGNLMWFIMGMIIAVQKIALGEK